MAKPSEAPKVVRMNSSSARGVSSSLSPEKLKVRKELDSLYRKYCTALKIMVISGITEASDFLSSYENFVNTASVIPCEDMTRFKTEREFCDNPIKAWAELFVAIVMILKEFPQSNILAEGISAFSSNYDGEKTQSTYYLLSFSVTTEAYDWKSHLVEVFIPKDSAKSRTLVIIDREPVFMT